MKGFRYHLAICLWFTSCLTECVTLDSVDLHERDVVGSQQDHNIVPEDDQKIPINDNSAADQQTDSHAELPSRLNDTDNSSNDTVHSTTAGVKATPKPTPKPILPGAGVKAQEEEQSSGMTIFFSLLVIGICIILVHLLIKFKLHFLPESVAVVSLGILMGGFIKLIEFQELANWKEEEMFRPNMFFLLLLPPIIFESGYSLHKGNFFQNIGSITLFAVVGTVISAFIVGGTSSWEETSGRPRTRWRDYISTLAWERLGIPQSELANVAREREVWGPLLELLPPRPDPG
ncbi:hypothetical protein DPEC_G00003220 [Dallia pectoralis]|uniref:Uncharacterized protein n=1 Tax=Dallia pectoralis TaxID=75939 RepID=A0ACC2HKA8_DALPE|nr:hypothetical protein DPEC_G00003220 [Dallia pectoralis]